MTITYKVKNGIYINMTNRCSNACEFCIRNNGEGVYGSDSLWLEHEPTVDEIIAAIDEDRLYKYDELVFCGYGEPTERLEEMLAVAQAVKDRYPIPIRLNTNGHGNLIAGKDITPLFKGLIDTVSVSLNCANASDYARVCHPRFGASAYAGVLQFAASCSRNVRNVVLSVVDTTIPKEDIEKCARLAEAIGVGFRIRPFE